MDRGLREGLSPPHPCGRAAGPSRGPLPHWGAGDPLLNVLDALVLRPTPFQEGGLVVSFLTEHGERVTGVAKGARKASAKWVSSFEPLSQVRLTLFGKEQSDIRRITRCELQASPLTLGHLASSLVVACLADLFDRCSREGVEDPRLFRLANACARALKADPDRALGILAYAEHWLLHLMGLLPHPRTCGRCGREDAPLTALQSDGGWVCAACTPMDAGEGLPPGAREHLRLLRTVAAEACPSPEDLDPAGLAITRLLRHRLLEELGGRLGSYEVLFQVLEV
jgi:DNA repair protein RecO